ncbi:MAG TPA: hypothetical protein VFW84_10720 [Aquabacterium sp.]|uniref:hypothetical protein n=1 Tax=Aquabacterium sp. TaxID=1872578 RepID=UPI002D94EADF|nr:hypothetical protein [Aquabacterium sp.]HET6789212.1 hypothetical protein [Aquabacterium sp.]HEX5373192.1 hypothetical protein [Aquabacterium sp.]
MSNPPRPAPSHVPILTEVIEPVASPLVEPPIEVVNTPPMLTEAIVAPPVVIPPPQVRTTVLTPPVVPAPSVQPPPVITTPPVALDEAQIAQRVLADVQRQIDGMLEYRLREALAPILMRTSETLVRELRQELSKTMRDVVARSVAQEIARQRPRS